MREDAIFPRAGGKLCGKMVEYGIAEDESMLLSMKVIAVMELANQS